MFNNKRNILIKFKNPLLAAAQSNNKKVVWATCFNPGTATSIEDPLPWTDRINLCSITSSVTETLIPSVFRKDCYYYYFQCYLKPTYYIFYKYSIFDNPVEVLGSSFLYTPWIWEEQLRLHKARDLMWLIFFLIFFLIDLRTKPFECPV